MTNNTIISTDYLRKHLLDRIIMCNLFSTLQHPGGHLLFFDFSAFLKLFSILLWMPKSILVTKAKKTQKVGEHFLNFAIAQILQLTAKTHF